MLYDLRAHAGWVFCITDVAFTRWNAEEGQAEITRRFEADPYVAIHYCQPFDLDDTSWLSLVGELGAALNGASIGGGLRIRYYVPPTWDENTAGSYVYDLIEGAASIVTSDFRAAADVIVEGLIVPILKDTADAAAAVPGALADVRDSIPWVTVAVVAVVVALVI